MRRLISILSLVFQLLIPPLGVVAQETTPSPSGDITIISPTPGQVLQGNISINTKINIAEVSSAELSFSYTDDLRNTWFLIREVQEQGIGDINVEWDTTALTDGEYTLRLIVFTDNEQFAEIVPGLRVRNYSPIETNTPFPTSTPAPKDTLTPPADVIQTPTRVQSSPTPLPPNPAQLNIRDIGIYIGQGVLFAVGSLGLLGFYAYLRDRRKRD